MLSETYFTTELAGGVAAAAMVLSAKKRTLCWVYEPSTGKQKYGDSIHLSPSRLAWEKSMKIPTCVIHNEKRKFRELESSKLTLQ